MTHYLAVVLVILAMGFGQIMLKQGSAKKKNWLRSFFHPYTLLGYGLYMLVPIGSIYALQSIYLKNLNAWTGLVYIFVVVLSRIILKERVNRLMILGCILIAAGVFVFSFPF
jgi:drug/metabolite transporter (DMT)-like permease